MTNINIYNYNIILLNNKRKKKPNSMYEREVKNASNRMKYAC